MDKSITSDDNEIHLFEGDEIKQAKIEMWIAKSLGTELVRQYPGREWMVTVDLDAESVSICAPLVNPKKGYRLSLQRSLVELTDLMKKVGGEILERAGLNRSRVVTDDLAALPRDFRDYVISSDLDTPQDDYDRRRRG